MALRWCITRKHETAANVKLFAVMNIALFVYIFWICSAGCIVFNKLVDMKTFRGSSQGVTKSRIPSYSLALARGVRISLRVHHQGHEIHEIALHYFYLLIGGILFSAVGILAGISLLLAPFFEKINIVYYCWIGVEGVVVLVYSSLGIYIVVTSSGNVLVLSSVVFFLPCPFLIWSLYGLVKTLLDRGGDNNKGDEQNNNKDGKEQPDSSPSKISKLSSRATRQEIKSSKSTASA